VPRRVTKPSAVEVARLGTPGDGDVPTRQKAERAPPRLPHGTSTCRGKNTRGETGAWKSFMLPRRHQVRQHCWGAPPWRTIYQFLWINLCRFQYNLRHPREAAGLFVTTREVLGRIPAPP
jgi:hypothetical protein